MYNPHFVNQYLKPGEMRRLLSPIDREVHRAIDAHTRTGQQIRFKTRLSKMAVVLACYRLVGLGLIEQKPIPRKRRRP